MRATTFSTAEQVTTYSMAAQVTTFTDGILAMGTILSMTIGDQPAKVQSIDWSSAPAFCRRM